MRRIAVLLFASLHLQGQPGALQSPAQLRIPAGASARRLVLPIDKPTANDRIGIDLSSRQLTVVIVTPTGRRITKENAEAAGFAWLELEPRPRIGEIDGGLLLTLVFSRADASGEYTIEVAGGVPNRESLVQAQFLSDRAQYESSMQQVQGFQKIGPQEVVSAVELALTLAADEEGPLFDIVVSDPDAAVELVQPDGRVLDSSLGKGTALSWTTTSDLGAVDPPDSIFGIAGFLLRETGTHHIVMSDRAARGTYRVRVRPASGQATVTAAFIPLLRILELASSAITNLGAPPPGGSRLQAFGFDGYDSLVGDELTVKVRFRGVPLADPIDFEVRAEYREIRRPARGEVEYGPPVVEVVPTTFTRGLDGVYSAKLRTTRPGRLRLGVTARGVRTDGQSFADETMIDLMTVHGIVAGVTAVSERALDTDGSGKFDQLEITAKLDVITPGQYFMTAQVSNPVTGGSLQASGRATLAAGETSLRATLSAAAIRFGLRDGPWIVESIRVTTDSARPTDDGVPVDAYQVRTAPYRLDQWDDVPQ